MTLRLERVRRNQGEESPAFLESKTTLAILYTGTGRYEAAEKMFNEILETERRVFGDDNPLTLEALYGLARLEAVRGNHEDALEQLRQAVDLGWANKRVYREKDFAPLRNDPTFETILQKVREKIPQNTK